MGAALWHGKRLAGCGGFARALVRRLIASSTQRHLTVTVLAAPGGGGDGERESGAPPQCPGCSSAMATVTGTEFDVYMHFSCNGSCGGDKSGSRWFCADCQMDYCFACEPEEGSAMATGACRADSPEFELFLSEHAFVANLLAVYVNVRRNVCYPFSLSPSSRVVFQRARRMGTRRGSRHPSEVAPWRTARRGSSTSRLPRPPPRAEQRPPHPTATRGAAPLAAAAAAAAAATATTRAAGVLRTRRVRPRARLQRLRRLRRRGSRWTRRWRF